MLSESQYAALLAAVPSFAPRWAAREADHRAYVARFPEEALSPRDAAIEFLWQLAWHVGEAVAAGAHPEELPRLFAALERLYAGADEDLWTQLTVGFLESVIYTAERGGADTSRLAAFTAGPETAHAWRAAYEYIHPPGGRDRRASRPEA